MKSKNYIKAVLSKAVLFVCIAVFSMPFKPADASMLPQNFRNYLISLQNVPSIRPDGVLMYGRDIMYLPVFPAYPENVKEIKAVKTYPEGKNISDFPDIIIFNNNFSLLKVIKTDENKLTVLHLEEYPDVIKTGALPSDLMVPSGLVFPAALSGITGDVYIPIEGSAREDENKSAKTSRAAFVSGRKAPAPCKAAVLKRTAAPAQLQNKLFFANNYRTEYLKVYSPSVSEPLYSLKTSGVMRDIKPVLNGKYILAASRNSNNIDVIDTEKEFIFKRIELPAEPSEITADDAHERVYISSAADESLFVIDLKTLKIIEKIQLAGAPKRTAVSPDGSKIAYYDANTSNIFILELDNDYSNKLITNYPNTSKIILTEDAVYLAARTEPKLRIVKYNLFMDNDAALTKKGKLLNQINQQAEQSYLSENAASDLMSGLRGPAESGLNELKVYSSSIKDAETGEKPLDMYKYGNSIFVLCAGNNTVYRYDIESGEITADKLPFDGFSNSFNPVPQSDLAVITNSSEHKYAVYDMEQGKTVQVLPINDFSGNMTILERKK